MEVLRFNAVMRIREGNPYIPMSKARVARVKPGWKRPLPVLVRIDGKPRSPWRINMMPAGDGTFYLYLHGEVRKASGTGVGDKVEVEVRFDPDYRGGPMHPMPDWFGSALRGHAGARKSWEALPPSRKKEVLRYFSRLKGEAARARNLEKALHVLSGKPGRFMARAWKDGA